MADSNRTITQEANAASVKGNDDDGPAPKVPSKIPMNNSWFGIPCEEVDPLILEDTFCVISKKYSHHYIYRFSATKSLFLLGPLNPIRKFTIYVTTNRWFDAFIILTIICNCFTLALITNNFKDGEDAERILPDYDHVVDRIEYAFLAIYTLELILKVLSKGLVVNKFSYLRNYWNILDLIVVVSGYVTILADIFDTDNSGHKKDNDLEFLRTFRVLRAVKTFSMLPGLRVMINALLSSVVHLLEVMALTMVCLMIFSQFGLEVFKGKLRQKCVVDKGGIEDTDAILHNPIALEPPDDRDRIWTEWVSDYNNWKRRDFPKEEPTMCGNGTHTRTCGDGFTCIANLGDNPDAGWTGFDTFFNAMLSTFQLLTLDYWERLYDVVVSTNGVWSVLFFLLVIFLGAYYLLNLMLAVVAMSYENEAQALEMDENHTYSEKLALARQKSTFSFDELSELHICKLMYYRMRTDSEKAEIARKLRLSQAAEAETEHTGEPHENVPFGDTIYSILGMRLALQSDESSIGFAPRPNPKAKQTPSNTSTTRSAAHPDSNSSRHTVDPSIAEDEDLGAHGSGSEVDADTAIKKKRSAALMWRQRVARTLKNSLTPIVNHTLFDLFITACIILNTVVLALEHHGESREFEDILRLCNHLFMAIFTAECIIKSMALQKEYLESGWNRFDLVIVIVSYIDLAIVSSAQRGSRGLSVIRSMRLLRVFKLAQSWITMKVLMNIIFSSFAALGNLTFVLFIVIYIFAVMGMQVVGGEYTPAAFDAVQNPSKFPKWNWKHFWYAFMMVFRVLCGEWIEPLWDCLQAQQKSLPPDSTEVLPYLKCFLLYLPILVVGNFIVLNLFLALLLNSFDTEELNAQRQRELEASGRAENMKNIVGLLLKKDNFHDDDFDEDSPVEDIPSGQLKPASVTPSVQPNTVSTATTTHPANPNKATPTTATPNKPPATNVRGGAGGATRGGVDSPARHRFKAAVMKVIMQNRKIAAERAIARVENKMKRERDRERFFLTNPGMRDKSQGFLHDVTPESSEGSEQLTAAGWCIPPKVWNSKHCPCRKLYRKATRRFQTRTWDKFRELCVLIVANPVFEWSILLLIFASSITLCFEDITLDSKPMFKKVLCYVNYAFTCIFFIEMILKWFALGIWGYFTNAWTLLDAGIVSISLISMYFDMTYDACSTSAATRRGASNLGALKALRTLRALRPLRAISRWQGMKIVVNALLYAIPSIFNVLLVCLLFWLVFSIMGVQFFKGQFYRCVDDDGSRVDARLAPNKDVCCSKTETNGFSWVNTISTYDNVFEGYLSLLQVATFEGWMELMEYSVDAVGVDKQPISDNQIEFYGFYVIFIIFGSFFTLQLFIGVIIDNFNMLKKKYEGNMLEILLTPTQRNYYIAMKNLGRKSPIKMIKRPTERTLQYFYDISMSRKLEIAIFVIIFLDMTSESFDNYNQHQYITHVLDASNSFFATVYVLEAIIKLIGLGSYYFTVPWNVFDFVLVLASLVNVAVSGDLGVVLPLPPTMLRVVRIFRIGRILRLVKAAKGIRKLLFALVVSLPALFNIGALLALITFIYAILGMALFSNAPRKWSIDDVFNFETFLHSNLMLLRLMTAAGWNEVLDSLTVIEPVCGSFRHIECGLPGQPECINRALVVAYIVSYLILTYLIVINLYIAIILENYVDASNEEDVGMVEDDLEMFYAHWSRYDPMATQFINFEDLPDFLDSLDEPLKVKKPNMVAIVVFNWPIARGNKIHCLDILNGLVKHVLGAVEDTPEFRKLQTQMERKFQRQFPSRRLLDVVSSTRRWKREHQAAITIQRAWRAYLRRKYPSFYEDHGTQTIFPGGYQGTDRSEHGGMGHMMNRMGLGSGKEINPDAVDKAIQRQKVADPTGRNTGSEKSTNSSQSSSWINARNKTNER